MGGRFRKPYVPPGGGLGPTNERVLKAIERDEVVRDPPDRGMWAGYLLGGEDVSLTVRFLWRRELISMPLSGPPTITADGRARLT